MLSEKLREVRLSRGMSQVELAKQLGVTKQSVSNWENDNIQPSVDMLVRLARLFGVSTDYLLGLTNNPAPAAVSGSDTVPGVPAWSTGTPPVSGLYVVKSGVPAEEGPQWTARRVIVWTGDQWVTNGPGTPFRDNVYAWFKIPED